MQFIEQLKFNEQGLIPAIVQDAETGEVLMMAWMNREALQRTIETGKATYWSRSRQKFWVKGETSGHFQEVRGVYIDCDADTVLLKVKQAGAACHEGYRSCFFRRVNAEEGGLEIIAERLVNPNEVYSR
ncbi:MAG: phosphoribosyl-AMP cyclohydrolase [Armatimonadota bacterium]